MKTSLENTLPEEETLERSSTLTRFKGPYERDLFVWDQARWEAQVRRAYRFAQERQERAEGSSLPAEGGLEAPEQAAPPFQVAPKEDAAARTTRKINPEPEE